MKTWKNKTRRGLASLLALVMCLSLLQITAFATDMDTENGGAAELSAPPTNNDPPVVTESEQTEETGIPPVAEEGAAAETDNPETPAEPEDTNIPLEDWAQDTIEVPLTQDEEGNIEGSADALDQEKIKEKLTEYGLTDEELDGLAQGEVQKEVDGTVTVIQVNEGQIIITETTASGDVTTKTIDLSNTDVTVNGTVGAFEANEPVTSEPTAVGGGELTDTEVGGLYLQGTDDGEALEAGTVTVTKSEDIDVNAIAAKGYWGAETGTGSLEYVQSISGIDLSEEDAKAATQAALFGYNPEGLEGNALAFYSFLTGKEEDVVEGEDEIPILVPQITATQVTVNVTEEGCTADVKFIVTVSQNSTGITVKVLTEDGKTYEKNLTTDDADDSIVKNEDGSYTVKLTGLKLSSESPAMDLKITTSEEIKEQEVYKVVAGVPKTDTIIAEKPVKIDRGDEKAQVECGNRRFEGKDYGQVYVKQANDAVIWIPAGDDRTPEQILAAAKETDNSLSGGTTKHIIINGNKSEITIFETDKKTGITTVTTESISDPKNVTVKIKETEVTVENGVLKVNGEISHVTMVDWVIQHGTSATTETYYGMTETTTTNSQSAELTLNLNIGNVTITTEQTPSGGGGTEPTDPTDPPNPPDPGPSNPDKPPRPSKPDPVPPPEVEIPDEDVPLEELPPTEPPEETPPELPEPVEIPEDDVPLVEIPDTKVPLADAPKAKKPAAKKPATVTVEDTKVPLSDVPKTGDSTGLWSVTLALSVCGLAVLTWKKDEDETV